VSNLGDLKHFFRALLGGRLLPPRLLAAMTTPVPTGQPGFGYGLGLVVIDTPAGRLLSHDGAIPGFLNIVLSTEDGRRQVGVMMNEEFSSPAVSEAFSQVFMTLAMGLLDGLPRPEPRCTRRSEPGWPSQCSRDRPTVIGQCWLQLVSAAVPPSRDHDVTLQGRRGGLRRHWRNPDGDRRGLTELLILHFTSSRSVCATGRQASTQRWITSATFASVHTTLPLLLRSASHRACRHWRARESGFLRLRVGSQGSLQ
jgi:hypothetical protein